jgi:hypothetical protein
MAAGNANDHRRTTREQPLADAIVAGDIRRIDLLRLTIGTGVDARRQYAHSYIGAHPLRQVIAVGVEPRAVPSRHDELGERRHQFLERRTTGTRGSAAVRKSGGDSGGDSSGSLPTAFMKPMTHCSS